MNSEISLLWVIGAAVVLTIIVGAIASYFSPEAKAGRRRRKSNAPIVNKSGRPTVKLSARTKKN